MRGDFNFSEVSMTFHLLHPTPDECVLCQGMLDDADDDDSSIGAVMSNLDHTAYIAIDVAEVVDAAVVASDDKEVAIMDLAVKQVLRGRGIGRQMIVALIFEARLRQM